MLRTPLAQNALLALAREKIAKQMRAGARPVRAVPPVQRPGNAVYGRGGGAAVERATAAANQNPSAKKIAALVAARRRAAQ